MMIKAIVIIFVLLAVAGIVAIAAIVKLGGKEAKGEGSISSERSYTAKGSSSPTISRKDANELLDLLEALHELDNSN